MRQWSTRSSCSAWSNSPTTVCVLPTSIASSISAYQNCAMEQSAASPPTFDVETPTALGREAYAERGGDAASEVQSDVEHGRRVGERADRDEVDTGGGVAGDG